MTPAATARAVSMSDREDLVRRLVTRVAAVGCGPEQTRQRSELARDRLRLYLQGQRAAEGLSPLPHEQFAFDFATAVTSAIQSGALREDSGKLVPAVDAYQCRDRERSAEILLSRISTGK